MKKREPEDEQLCITVNTIICSKITPRHIKIDRLDHTALHNMGAHPGSQNGGDLKTNVIPKLREGIPIKPKLSHDIEFSQVYLFVIVYCIYTPTGKREDLWDAHVKRPKSA